MTLDRQVQHKTLLCPNQHGLVRRMTPRLFRSNLALAEEDIMSDQTDLARKMVAFSLILERGNSRQILGLFETGLCSQEKEQEIVWRAAKKLALEVEQILPPSYDHDPYREEHSHLALEHRRNYHLSIWSVLTSGNVKNSETQIYLASLVISNFVDITVDNFDLSKLHSSTVEFITSNDCVKSEIQRRELAKIPTVFSRTVDLSSSNQSTESIYSSALTLTDPVSVEIHSRAFFSRIQSNISSQTIEMVGSLLSSQNVSVELFTALLPSTIEALGVDYLSRLRDNEHFGRTSNLGPLKLNALKIFLNELECAKQSRSKSAASQSTYEDYSDIEGE